MATGLLRETTASRVVGFRRAGFGDEHTAEFGLLRQPAGGEAFFVSRIE